MSISPVLSTYKNNYFMHSFSALQLACIPYVLFTNSNGRGVKQCYTEVPFAMQFYP